MGSPTVVLASRSPQRKAILEQIGIEFEVVASDVEELRDGEPSEVVEQNALAKARSVAARVGSERLVLGADTEVYLDERIFGKATDEREAREHLAELSGRTHDVFSAIALIAADNERLAVARTAVRFRVLAETTIEWYLATGEWRERAGAYAIQGKGGALVESIEGDFWNVVGLPLPLLLELEPSLLGHR